MFIAGEWLISVLKFPEMKKIISSIAIFFLACHANAQEFPYIKPTEPLVIQKLQDWQDWKFGVIIHWGAYSQWGVVESWSLCPEDEGWCVRRGPYASDYTAYKKAYENIRKEFNPINFNPDKWAAAAKGAGMKYVVFTTKHHDGFCMFDTKYTDYKITDAGSAFGSNPKSNVAKEVFSSFNKQGLAIGAYFSKPDWHNENYWWPYFPSIDRNVNYDPKKYPEKWKSFQDFTYNQVEELMKGYGKIDILWLDGGWVRPAESLTEESRPWIGKNQWIQDVNIPRIADMARKLQPGLLMVDRSVHGAYENYRTPEQQVPTTVPGYPWESCITLGDAWYSTGPNGKYKSVKQVIQLLINIVAKGGNLLLGLGPDKTGDLVPEVYERLKGIGEWMNTNSEAIYATVPYPPYQTGQWRFTKSRKTETLYASYLAGDNEMSLPKQLSLSGIHPSSKSKIFVLGYDEALSWNEENGGLAIHVPVSAIEKLKQQPAWVFKIVSGK